MLKQFSHTKNVDDCSKTNFSSLEQPDNPSPQPFHQSGDSYGIKGSSRPPCTKTLVIRLHKVDTDYTKSCWCDKSVDLATLSRWLKGRWRVCWDFLPRLWIKIATWQDRTVRFFSCIWHWKVWHWYSLVVKPEACNFNHFLSQNNFQVGQKTIKSIM